MLFGFQLEPTFRIPSETCCLICMFRFRDLFPRLKPYWQGKAQHRNSSHRDWASYTVLFQPLKYSQSQNCIACYKPQVGSLKYSSLLMDHLPNNSATWSKERQLLNVRILGNRNSKSKFSLMEISLGLQLEVKFHFQLKFFFWRR